ncbi:MAG: helix-turn-helix domain-containing protein [Candidatus Thermoplasmatota archaeon]
MDIKNVLAEKIAGEITLSPTPGRTIRKWRNVFEINQTDLAKTLDMSPSVISDYESGRRKSPGIQTVKKIIDALIEIDEKRGGKTLNRYDSLMETHEGIIDIMEYPFSITAKNFVEKIDGNVVTSNEKSLNKNIKGFTLVDSVKTIKNINSKDYVHLYGWSTERAIIFTGITYGRSPMIAVRVHPVKPSMVVYHDPGGVDPLAIKLADQEKIPLVVSNMQLQDLKKKLRNIEE